MTAKLNQVIAVVSGKKKKVTDALTTAYHTVQKTPLFDGIDRTYAPKDEDGEKFPSERKAIQVKAKDLVKEVAASLTEMYDVVATQDYANCRAKADVVVDGKPILTSVPVTHLLFLEKQLKDVETFVSKLPTLDPSEVWQYNQAGDFYSTIPAETAKTKKIPRAFVKYDATKEHPAQVETFHEDILVGYWKTVKSSGALPSKEKNAMLERVRKLQEAVMKAREEANSVESPNVSEGEVIFKYVFGG